MRKIIITLILLLGLCPLFNLQFSTLKAQNLYIGSFYVTSSTEEANYGDGRDKWTTRLGIITDLLNFEQPDVMGLQALTETQLSQISKRMTSHNLAGDILYSKSLQLDSCNTVSDMPEGSTCSWAKLQKDGKAFYVFNICFSTENSVALTSANRVRDAAAEINTENLPCFVIGFLGVTESKTPYTRLTAKYYDCYKQASVVSAEYGTVNNFDLENNHSSDRYDYIFASKTVSVKAYGQLQSGYYTLESDNTYKRRTPSTHFPVMAKVVLPK